MNPEQWLSLKWNGGSTMSDRWLNQSKIIQPIEELQIIDGHPTHNSVKQLIEQNVYDYLEAVRE